MKRSGFAPTVARVFHFIMIMIVSVSVTFYVFPVRSFNWRFTDDFIGCSTVIAFIDIGVDSFGGDSLSEETLKALPHVTISSTISLTMLALTLSLQR